MKAFKIIGAIFLLIISVLLIIINEKYKQKNTEIFSNEDIPRDAHIWRGYILAFILFFFAIYLITSVTN